MSEDYEPFPLTVSVAGFKALPHSGAPVIHLPGVAVLTGSNSSGKSSLMLALRLLRESLVHEPAAERLHLRAPGLPAARLGSIWTLYHDSDVFRPIRYRFCTIVDGDPAMLELAYRSDDVLARLGEAGSWTSRAINFPLAIPLYGATVYRLGAPLGQDRVMDPWSPGWLPLDDAMLRDRLIATVRSWAVCAAPLDSIRGRTLTSMPQVWAGGAASVFPDGSNAITLIAQDSYAGLSPEGEWMNALLAPDIDPHCGVEHWLEVLCCYLGIEQLADEGNGPAQPARVGKQHRIMDKVEATEDPADPDFVVLAYNDGHSCRVPRKAVELMHSKSHTGQTYQQSAGGFHELGDLGDGQQQVVPALLQLILSEPGTCLLWEHPDLHLHPGAMTQLGRLIHRVCQAGRSVIVETHSRDLIDGIRLQAAAWETQRAQASARGEDAQSRGLSVYASLVCFHREEGSVRTSEHDLLDAAVVMPWPEGFVDTEQSDRAAFLEKIANKLSPTDPASVRDFVAQNEEGQVVEYKSAFRWNQKDARNDDEVKLNLLRDVCAFLNSRDGGILIVGVDDDRNFVGIEHDTGGVRDNEKFQRMLVGWVVKRIHPTAWSRFLDIKFADVDGKSVAVLVCKPSTEPMVLRRGQDHQFLVREGNASLPLSSAKEQLDWIRSRWLP